MVNALCGKRQPARRCTIYIVYSSHSNLQYLGGHRYNNFYLGAYDTRDTTTTKWSFKKCNKLKWRPVAKSGKSVSAADVNKHHEVIWGEQKRGFTTHINAATNNPDQAGSSSIGDGACVFSDWSTWWELKRTWLLLEMTTNDRPDPEHSLQYLVEYSTTTIIMWMPKKKQPRSNQRRNNRYCWGLCWPKQHTQKQQHLQSIKSSGSSC